MFMVNPLNIHSPMLDGYYQELINKDREKYEQIFDIYVLSRIILTKMNPKFEDFVKGVPVWLISISDVILEAYDQVNKRHIKIVRSNGRFRYLTSIISDKWEEVLNVPPEMDIIVQYLISNRANLAFTN